MDIGHMMMAKRHLLILTTLVILFFVGDRFTGAQDDSTSIRVNVDLVQLNVAVTDSKGNYVSGLGPESFSITEDKIPERIATFEEGNAAPRQVSQTPPAPGSANSGSGKPSAKATPKSTPTVETTETAKPHPGGVADDNSSMSSQLSGANVF